MRMKIFLFTILAIFLIGIISAQGVSYCCEKTTSGAWCQNADQDQCDTGSCGAGTCNKAPTSCQSTSYCRLGTCVNSKEGNCMPNTPQRVCTAAGGFWDARKKTEIPQCQLGCCLIGDQAAFTTQVRCKRLSSDYGLEVNFRADIQNEVQCISSAAPQARGACVFEKEFERDCKVLTKKECQDLQLTSETAEFHEGYLCTAEWLQTVCRASTKTTCVEGKEEVYYLDTCGNVANVVDEVLANTPGSKYWEEIKESTCEVGNLGGGACGNCDYLSGTTCRQEGVTPASCKELKCNYNGQEYQHGETWCSSNRDDTNGDKNTNLPGGKYLRMICYNNEVTVEPCAEFRQETCIQSSIPTSGEPFKTAACRPNKWQDCYSQTEEKECLNQDRRDCQWIKGKSIFANTVETVSETTPAGVKSLLPSSTGQITEEEKGSCAPKYAPGFDYWKNESDAASICSLANDICQVEYMTPIGSAAFSLFGGQPPKYVLAGDSECIKKCKEKCLVDDPTHLVCDEPCANQCRPISCLNSKATPGGDLTQLKDEWRKPREAVCKALGDCGVKNNYNGKPGYFDDWEKAYVREEQNQTEAQGGQGGLGGGVGGIFGQFFG